MLEKTFSPQEVEQRIYAGWEYEGAFKAGRADRRNAEPFSIVIPPPNVTGSLHMGHALNNTLQDILARFERMRGKDVLWQPGTDHAGIATQMVVERKLAAEGRPDRRTMGRDAFLKEVWQWKAESGGTILNQLKRLGASCDWSRERFTMDEGLSRAVAEFFVALHEAGLLYKDKRLVNWDPKLLTAISDLEVEQREVRGSFAWARGEVDKEGNPKPFSAEALAKVLAKEPGGHLYYFDYPIEGTRFDPNDPATYITVATTRPETMLGDTAVAVHPENEKLKGLIGKQVRLPLVGRLIPIVADDYADPEKGTGAVKITPAHDFNDFEVGKRHDLEKINMLDREGKIDLTDGFDGVPAETAALAGLPRYEARVKIVAMLEAQGLLRKIEVSVQQVPHGDRSGVPIEPWLTEQWYVDVKPLADKAMGWVRNGKTTILPANREADFFRWLEHIEPWCISRQLWWGHQIPAWYGPDGAYVVARDEEAARTLADAKWGKGSAITRDADVLDTWFSSALWPFSTLGWPDATAELARYYPTSVLVTGFDILFFWVARMMMASAQTQADVPFRTVYLHGLVRDEKGAKMSKSKGNVIDPLDLIEQFGADALRFTLASLAAQGRDPRLGAKNVEGYRNFATKLWNAARFCEMNECQRTEFNPRAVRSTLAKWIIGETAKAAAEVTAALEAYRFNDAAGAAYRFVWNVFCDWFLEFAKPVFTGTDAAEKAEIRATAAWVLDQILRILHPFMPFITEELWRVTGEQGPKRTGSLMLADWPELAGLVDAGAGAEIGWLVDLITTIRSVRSEMAIQPGVMLPLTLVSQSDETEVRASRYADLLKRLARISEISFARTAPKGTLQIVAGEDVAALHLAGIIDLAAEKARLSKEMARAKDDIARVDQKLGNANFVARAPEDVIEGEKEKREEAAQRLAKVEEALARLADIG